MIELQWPQWLLSSCSILWMSILMMPVTHGLRQTCFLTWPDHLARPPQTATLINVNVQCDLTITVGRAFTERSRGGTLFRSWLAVRIVILRPPPQLAVNGLF